MLSSLEELSAAKPVPAEGIETFLKAEGAKMEVLLAEEEAWAKANLAWYPALPPALAFRAEGQGDDLRVRFCHAIRVNPTVKFPLYLQLVPARTRGEGPPWSQRASASCATPPIGMLPAFVALKEGEMVRPLEVAVSATDEPDLLGVDVGLFADNGTDFGKS